MPDFLRQTPKTPDTGSLSVGTAEQIERLLLTGLDLYFNGQYQEAIDAWTRVAFLERGHGRARAYIERARTAIAERHREADERFHQGREAYDAGEFQRARQLLTSAVEGAGASDEALLLLHRLNRFDDSSGVGQGSNPVPDAPRVGRTARRTRWGPLLGLAAAGSALALLAAPLASWLDGSALGTERTVAAAPPARVPIVRIGDVVLGRARKHYESGHLTDALAALSVIEVGDPRHSEAVQLSGDIQRALLATVRQPARPSAPGLAR